uniref:Uncharacterized protein n=1 Tax=Vespula pensylvanica TaxID=30213 RepID=A0A834NRJ8_VESPE|nr:hypothetical protein H0235_011109 [Vespula pensylvanica]
MLLILADWKQKMQEPKQKTEGYVNARKGYIEETDTKFTSMTEFERVNLHENGNAFDTTRLETKNSRTKTKDRRFTSMQEGAMENGTQQPKQKIETLRQCKKQLKVTKPS